MSTCVSLHHVALTSKPPWHQTLNALMDLAQWWLPVDGVDEAAPRIVERLWRERERVFAVPSVVRAACGLMTNVQYRFLDPQGRCVLQSANLADQQSSDR